MASVLAKGSDVEFRAAWASELVSSLEFPAGWPMGSEMDAAASFSAWMSGRGLRSGAGRIRAELSPNRLRLAQFRMAVGLPAPVRDREEVAPYSDPW